MIAHAMTTPSGSVLITRPADDAEQTAAQLRGRGLRPIVEPLLVIRPRPIGLRDASGVQALVLTSANAVRALPHAATLHALPVFAVGDHTADEARKLGFSNVTSCAGTATDLITQISATLSPAAGKILHARGVHQSVDLAAALNAQGFTVEEDVVYDARPVATLSSRAISAIRSGEITDILLYSKRTADTLVQCLKDAGLTRELGRIRCLCLSDSVLESVRHLPWAGAYASETPDASSLLDLLQRMRTSFPQDADMAEPTRHDPDTIPNAGDIIERFGGIRPMANKMGVPVTTVQGWKKRDAIPMNRKADLLRAAKDNGISLPERASQAPAAPQEAPKASMPDPAPLRPTPELREPVATVPPAPVRTEAPLNLDRPAAPPTPAAPGLQEEEIMARIRKSTRSAIWKGAMSGAAMMTVILGVGAFLIGPDLMGMLSHTERLSELEEELKTVRDDNSALRGLIPEDLQGQLSKLQQGAQEIRQQVVDVSTKMESALESVAGPNAGPLSERLTKLESELGSVTALAQFKDLGDLTRKFESLQTSVQGQEQLEKTVAELRKAVESMQSGAPSSEQDVTPALEEAQKSGATSETMEGVAQQDVQAAAMLLGLAQMRNALDRDKQSFEDDLALLRLMVGEDNTELLTAIDKLAPKAKDGVLTPEGLSKEFKGLTGDIVTASLKGEDVSISEKLQARVGDILKIEKDGELLTGTQTQATVDKAQKLLDEGDVKGAIAVLKELEGPAADEAKPWIDEAQAHLLAQQVQQMLTRNVLSSITTRQVPLTTGGSPLRGISNTIKEMVPNGSTMIHDPKSGFRMLPQTDKPAPLPAPPGGAN